MLRQSWPKYLGALTIVGMVWGDCGVAAEKSVYTADEVATLLQRLEESESRIDEFESKLKQIEANQQKLETNDQEIVEFISTTPEVRFPTAVPASAEESSESFDDFIAATEKRWEEQLKTNKDLEKAIKGSVQPGGKDITMKLTGRIHADYWAFPGDSPGTNAFETGDSTNDPDDRIGFRRLRFGVVVTSGRTWVIKSRWSSQAATMLNSVMRTSALKNSRFCRKSLSVTRNVLMV
ncbi:MAG: hypothetical protein R3C11_19830 [Planctomycetaceae bacterium]